MSLSKLHYVDVPDLRPCQGSKGLCCHCIIRLGIAIAQKKYVQWIMCRDCATRDHHLIMGHSDVLLSEVVDRLRATGVFFDAWSQISSLEC